MTENGATSDRICRPLHFSVKRSARVRGPVAPSWEPTMSNPQLVHPAAQQWTAIGLGQLQRASMLEIESHLAECPACLEAAASVADDTLVGLLRSAVTETDDKPASQKNPAQTPTTCASPPAPAVPELPPELAQHSRYRMAELLGV